VFRIKHFRPPPGMCSMPRHIIGNMQEPEKPVVLVVDGEASVLKNVSSLLGKAGFKVLTAHGASAAQDLCTQYREPIQLAIVDTALAANSPDVVESLYTTYPGLRILFTSGPDDSGAAARQLARPGRVREFLQKPFRRAQLLGRVLQVLDTPMVRTA
jgi:response regulator RpfG family c-di-GMP phosphodiesterase